MRFEAKLCVSRKPWGADMPGVAESPLSQLPALLPTIDTFAQAFRQAFKRATVRSDFVLYHQLYSPMLPTNSELAQYDVFLAQYDVLDAICRDCRENFIYYRAKPSAGARSWFGVELETERCGYLDIEKYDRVIEKAEELEERYREDSLYGYSDFRSEFEDYEVGEYESHDERTL